MRNRFKPHVVFVSLLALALHACSGGGGGSSSPLPATAAGAVPAGVAPHYAQPSAQPTPGGGSSAGPLFADTFAAGTAGWQPASGTWMTCSTPPVTWYCERGTSTESIAGATGWRNYTATMELLPTALGAGEDGASVLVRVVDPAHYYALAFMRAADGTTTWTIRRTAGNGYTSLAGGRVAFNAGSRFTARLDADGPKLTASFSTDGTSFQQLGAANDGTYASGAIGVRTWGAASVSFTNVLVTADSGPVEATPAPTSSPAPAPSPTIGDTVQPGAGWMEPFTTNPFVQRVASAPALDPNSSSQIAELFRVAGSFSLGEIQVPGVGQHQGLSGEMFPVYYSTPADPVYTLHCTLYSNCPLEGKTMHIPAGAVPSDAPGSDAHMVIVDLTDGTETVLYKAPFGGLPANGGTISIGYGGSCAYGSYANGGACNAAGTAGGLPMAPMLVRPVDIVAATAAHGDLGHVIYISTCSASRADWPSQSGIGLDQQCPADGARIWLDLSDVQIAALNVPEWVRVFYRTMAHYGLMVDDSGGAPWSFGFEDDNGRTALGLQPQWPSVISLINQDARQYGIDTTLDPRTGSYHIGLPFPGITQANLHVLAPVQM